MNRIRRRLRMESGLSRVPLSTERGSSPRLHRYTHIYIYNTSYRLHYIKLLYVSLLPDAVVVGTALSVISGLDLAPSPPNALSLPAPGHASAAIKGL